MNPQEVTRRLIKCELEIKANRNNAHLCIRRARLLSTQRYYEYLKDFYKTLDQRDQTQ